LPIKRGKRESWACGTVYSVGWVNFLTDPEKTVNGLRRFERITVRRFR
jgi:hypothetical protein